MVMLYEKESTAWCSDTKGTALPKVRQKERITIMRLQPSTALQRKRPQYFSCASLTADGSLTCPSLLDCQDAMPTPPSYGCELPGPRLSERMG